jgi:hypothetical protein
MVNRPIKLAGLAACLAAILAMNGGHWLALKSLAWGRMIWHFSQREPLGTAIAKTFSGQYPCPLCLKIRQGWHQEQQREQKLPCLPTEKMPEPFWEWQSVGIPLAPTGIRDDHPFVPQFHCDFIDCPPTPPPRACA